MTSSNSISGAKLLQNVEKSYEKGKKVLDESRKNGVQLHKVYHDYSVGERDKEYLEAVENGNNGNVIPLSERFNESDPDVRFFWTKEGEAYGFTVGGKIYIDPRYVNAETPIHEYTHLWAEALRRGNAEEWRNVIELMRGTSVWDEVREQYPELKTEDEIAEEVLAQYSGRRGAERLREEMRKAAHGEGATMDKARAVSVLERVRLALERFWRSVTDFLHVHFTSAEEVADRVLADLLNGVNPLRSVEERAIVERAKADGTYMKAPNGRPTKLSERQWVQVRTEAFKEWFGDWEKAARARAVQSLSAIEIAHQNMGKGELYKVYKALEPVNKDGRVVAFYHGAFKKNYIEKGLFAQIVPQLREVFEQSILAYEEADNLGGTGREDGTIHKEQKNIMRYQNYVGKVRITGNEYYVRFTVQEERSGMKGAHSFFVSNVEVYSNPTESRTIPITSRGTTDFDGIVDAKLRQFFESAKDSSKILDENGEPLVMWHETGSVFTIFNPRRVGAGASDYMTPFGIFLKDSSAPIDVARGGDVNQMALYVKMRNPIEFANREEMEYYLRLKCEGYAKLSDRIKNIDAEYGKKYDDAEKAEEQAEEAVSTYEAKQWSR